MFDRDQQSHRSAARPESGRSALRHDVRRRSRQSCVRRRDRHGIVLVFVVVLLVLLAIMGTAFLAVSRADRQNVTGRGASADGAKRALLRDTSLFDRLVTETEDRAKEVILDDLFGRQARTIANYRGGPNYMNFTAHGSFLADSTPGGNATTARSGQEWLASLLPDLVNRSTGVLAPPRASAGVLPQQPDATWRPAWPWMSAPLADGGSNTLFSQSEFADPRDPSGTRFTRRRNVIITSVPMQRAADTEPGPRLYPGGILPGATSGAFIAADADGDGIADSFLTPFQIDSSATGVNRFWDQANNCIYFYAVRIVDESAKVNVNTALSARSDIAISLGTTPFGEVSTDSTYAALRQRPLGSTTSSLERPNLGFFRGNVGLVDLFDGLEPYYAANLPPVVSALGSTVRQAEVDRLLGFRMPGFTTSDSVVTFNAFAPLVANSNPDGATLNVTANSTASLIRSNAVGTPFQFRSAQWTSAAATVAGAGAASSALNVRYLSIGDYLDHGVASRSDAPSPWSFTTGAEPTDAQMLTSVGTIYRGRSFGDDSSQSLAARAGAVRPSRFSVTSVESTLADTTLYSASNYGVNVSNAWEWFPANEGDLWYTWTHDFRTVLDGQPDALFAGLTNSSATLLPSYDARTGQVAVHAARSLRPLLTTASGVSQGVPTRPLLDGMAKYGVNTAAGQHPATRVAAATAKFAALWRAFYSVMTDASGDALGGGNAFSDENIFRWGRSASQSAPGSKFSLLSGAGGVSRQWIAALRGAIAAANTVSMRRVGDGVQDPAAGEAANLDRDMPAFLVPLGTFPTGGSNSVTYRARVFGFRPQPFITEAIATPGDPADQTGTRAMYLELYNPYPFPIDLSTYTLAVVERKLNGSTATASTSKASHDPATSWLHTPRETGALSTREWSFPLNGTIPAGGFVVVGDGTIDPTKIDNTSFAGPGAPARLITAALSKHAMGREVVLMRKRRGDGTPYQPRASLGDSFGDQILNTTEVKPVSGRESIEIDPFVPVDAVDLRTLPDESNVSLIDPDGTGPLPPVPYFFEYRRPTGGWSGAGEGDRWRCVYAGPMQRAQDPDGTLRPAAGTTYDATLLENHQRKVGAALQDVLAIRDTSANTPPSTGRGSLGRPNRTAQTGAGLPVPTTDFNTTTDAATFLSPVINLYFPSTNSLTVADRLRNDAVPYGTPFARDGDLINVPFIGHYIIDVEQAGRWVPIEFVPISIDAVAADNIEASTSINPSVGRFDPLQTPQTTWATRLTDFVSARHGGGDVVVPAVPNLVENSSGLPTADSPIQGAEAANPVLVRWNVNTGITGTASLNPVVEVAAASAPSLLQGKINLNTAPAAVLRMLPLIVDNTGRINRADTEAVAAAIENLRRLSPAGAIKSLDELRTLTAGGPAYEDALPAITSRDQLFRAGDITPAPGGADLGDYKRKTLNVTRLSNLATTRSDVFTVYITVQAWSYKPDGGGWLQTRDSRLIAEKRSAFIVDRSSIVPFVSGTTLDVKKTINDLKVIDIERD
jgi:hypothetical protein